MPMFITSQELEHFPLFLPAKPQIRKNKSIPEINSKFEARISKQILMTKIQNPKQMQKMKQLPEEPAIYGPVVLFGDSDFGFVSNFALWFISPRWKLAREGWAKFSRRLEQGGTAGWFAQIHRARQRAADAQTPPPARPCGKP
ncbi:MAG: hypothetical protein KGY42_00565 [Desulfobacterales bacterium]|nr:hypothetical protein [Desulfobacterales bacterium]MBS3754173.1 hypothetical protein [Desulfobacterales bacterium]